MYDWGRSVKTVTDFGTSPFEVKDGRSVFLVDLDTKLDLAGPTYKL